MRRACALVAALIAAAALAAPPAATAKDVPAYPEGLSSQTLEDHSFDLIVPNASDVKPPYSLLVVIPDAGTSAQQFLPLASDGWVILLPKQRFRGKMWATSETKDIHDDVDSVAEALSVPKNGVHLLSIHDYRGFASFVAYDKRMPFASVSYAHTEWSGVGNGRSPPGDARKRLGVLLMGEGAETPYGDPEKLAASLAEKVRTAEYRRDETPFKPYFRYWLSVMDGRFKPGYDLSFAWIEDAPPAPPARSGAKDPPPAPVVQNALDAAKARVKASGSAALVYFWSAEDADSPTARALQCEVFFDADLRAAVARLVAVKLDRARYSEAFARLGLKTTPAVAVVDAEFGVLDRFEGTVTAKALTKALVKAAAPAKSR